MRIALLVKDPLAAFGLNSALSHEGNFDVTASERNARACVSAAKDQRAQVLVVDAEGLQRNELEYLMGARAYGDFGIALVVGEGDEERLLQPKKKEEAPAVAGENVEEELKPDLVYQRSQGGPKLLTGIRMVGNDFTRSVSGRVRESRGGYGNKFELSRREFEVASLVAKGYSNRKVSEVVGLKEQSVKNLVSVIMRKLKCENRVQVALRLSAAKIEDEGRPTARTGTEG